MLPLQSTEILSGPWSRRLGHRWDSRNPSTLWRSVKLLNQGACSISLNCCRFSRQLMSRIEIKKRRRINGLPQLP